SRPRPCGRRAPTQGRRTARLARTCWGDPRRRERHELTNLCAMSARCARASARAPSTVDRRARDRKGPTLAEPLALILRVASARCCVPSIPAARDFPAELVAREPRLLRTRRDLPHAI